MTASTAITQHPSLLSELAAAQGLDPMKFYAAVKTLCGCAGATDEHYAGLLMISRQFGLNPIMRHLYLVPTARGVSVVMGVDGYLVFLRRAETDGVVTRHETEEGWFPDPRFPPAEKKVRRGCKARLWFDGEETPREHVEWFDEVARDTQPWKQMPSRMIGHKAMSQAVRRYLGLYVMDTDEAAKIADEPRRSDAEVVDTTPAIPIPALAAPVATQAPQEIAPPEVSPSIDVSLLIQPTTDESADGTAPAPAAAYDPVASRQLDLLIARDEAEHSNE